MFEEESRRFFLLLLILSMCYVLIFGEEGLFTYIRLKSELKKSAERILVLKEENSKMKKEIDRLRNDLGYLEEVVREKHGFIKEGEKLYRLEP